MEHIGFGLLVIFGFGLIFSLLISEKLTALFAIGFLQLLFSMISVDFLYPNGMAIIYTNAFIDLVALGLMRHQSRKAFLSGNSLYITFKTSCALIFAMIITHVLAGFDLIADFDIYYSILNTLTLGVFLCGIYGGVMTINARLNLTDFIVNNPSKSYSNHVGRIK